MTLPLELVGCIAAHCEVNTAARLRVAFGWQYKSSLPKNIDEKWIAKHDAVELLQPYIQHVRIASLWLLWGAVAQFGAMRCLKWLHQNCPHGCTTWTMDSAADGGQLGVIQWLHEHRTEGCTPGAMARAAQDGHLDVIKWLHTHNKGHTGQAICSAAVGGHLEVLKWMHANIANCITKSDLYWAAHYGNLKVAIWLDSILMMDVTAYKKLFEWLTPLRIANKRQRKVLQWLQSKTVQV